MPVKNAQQVALVSGGNGFLGTALIRELIACGVTVHALGNRRQQSLSALLPSACIHVGERNSLQITELVGDIQPSTIFHLAAVSKEPETPSEIEAMIECNLRLGINLLFAASQQKTRPVFVNAGSYWQFGDSLRCLPNCLYAATKQSFHELMLYYRDKYRIPALTLILYDTFGPDDARSKLWNRLVAAPPAAAIPLTRGEQVVHLVHVTDVVRAFLKAADLLQSGCSLDPLYSVHSLHPRTLNDLVTELNIKAGLGLSLLWGNLPYAKDQIFDPWIGEYLPGWQPHLDALEALVEHASTHRVNTGIHGVQHVG